MTKLSDLEIVWVSLESISISNLAFLGIKPIVSGQWRAYNSMPSNRRRQQSSRNPCVLITYNTLTGNGEPKIPANNLLLMLKLRSVELKTKTKIYSIHKGMRVEDFWSHEPLSFPLNTGWGSIMCQAYNLVQILQIYRWMEYE